MARLLSMAEVGAIAVILALLRRLGPVHASNLGGWVARVLGARMPVSRVADANLKQVFPQLDAGHRRAIIRGVWENLGRTAAEMPHLARLDRSDAGPGWEILGEEILHRQAALGGPAIFFSGHIGNWEMLPPILVRTGIAMSSFYRALPNSQLNAMLNRLRHEAVGRDLPMFAKGAQRARGALLHLSRGGYLGMLVDQKMNDGIPLPFFGMTAMTAPALAALALRFRCPVIPGRIRRLGAARLRLEVEPPLSLPDSGNREADIEALMLSVNQTLERWIREEPQSWLWLHRRWPRDCVPV